MQRGGMKGWGGLLTVLGLAGLPGLVGVEAATGAPQLREAVSVAPPTSFVPVEPFRILDTRAGVGTGGLVVAVGAGETIELQVAGVGTIPADAVGVVLNLTGTGTTAPTWVAAWPAGAERQDTSVLNLTPGIDAPNMVTALLGEGKLALYNNAGTTHLVADAAGYLVASGSGQSGPPGPVGPQGPQGPTGAQGPAGLSALQFVQAGGSAPVGQGGGASVTCPAGKRVISGGGYAQDISLRLYASYALSSTTWTVTFARDIGSSGSSPANFQVVALCALVDP